MLKEIENVKQDTKNLFRRWFTDDYLDLIIWIEHSNKIFGFQLCYNKGNNEHSLTWDKKNGYRHNRVDDGEVSYRIKRTPILVSDGYVPLKKIKREFLKRGKKIDKEILSFILCKLENCLL
ncbi:MAG: hypothetical protein KKH98_09850 [Spirochaetes bacterium]|nr:hypothetical protein [Spirochaetota bacterium]